MVDVGALSELDAGGVLAEAERAQAVMVQAEARRFWLAGHWVDLHAGETLAEERRRTGFRALPGMERAKRSGADGTPLVAEFAAMELGAVLGMGHVAAEAFQRDAVNVRHRHPLLWSALLEGRGRVWQARKVSRMCASAGLDRDQARWVDAVTTGYIGSLPWGRFESLVEAKIVEVDPLAAEQRRRAAALARFVRTGQSGEFGLRTIVARATAGDAVFFVAMVDRIAEVLAERGDTDPVDVRRSKAIGVLANPARAVAMLQQSAAAAAGAAGRAADDPADAGTHDTADADEAGPDNAGAEGSGAGEATDGFPEPAADPDPEERGAGTCPSCGGSGVVSGDPTPFTLPAAVQTRLDRLDPRSLLPTAKLYIHVSAEALSSGAGVARMEGVGPITIGQVKVFLRHCRVQPVQVFDVAGQQPVDGYEVPARMREALHLRQPACSSPWGTNLSRRKDADHVVPYLPPDR
ncbi:MAG TPA: hypothetical protein VFZ64_02445, partial [Nocardioidaceae bacterium]